MPLTSLLFAQKLARLAIRLATRHHRLAKRKAWYLKHIINNEDGKA